MAWRGSTTTRDKIFACLVYLVPLLEVLPFGSYLLDAFPPLGFLFLPVIAIWPIYSFSIGGLEIVSMALFIGLYVGIVRNDSMRHFLRFNTMQALLLAIVVFLCALLLSLLGLSSVLKLPEFEMALSPMVILANALFLAVVGSSIYSITRCVQGLYAEIPFVSEAAYTQTHY